MSAAKHIANGEPNLVSSFKTAFVRESGVIKSICIKYAMHDRTFRLSHWNANLFHALCQCIEYYSGVHYFGSHLQRVSDDPTFANRLRERHPVRTMTSERPDFTDHDYRAAQERFSIVSFIAADEGETLSIQCRMVNGEFRVDALPAFIAMNLYGSLTASVNLCGLIVSESRGLPN
jgi:hypothetical protein